MKYSVRFLAALGFVLSFGSLALAHEGHDAVPGAIKTSHGGVAKAGKEINLEYVVSGTEIAFYPMSHEGKDLLPTELKLTATSKGPKGKMESLKVDAQAVGFKTNVDFKDAYRTEVIVKTDVKGKKDTFKLQVEKQ